jgi:hypothetical protein
MKEWIIVSLIIFFVWFILKNSTEEGFGGYGICGGDCSMGRGLTYRTYYGRDDDYSTCYTKKKIYLNSVGTNDSSHGEVMLEKRFGKLYITLNCNLPYAKGGVFHTSYGAYHAFLVKSKNEKDSIYLGTLVRHGDRFYKLTTELLGDYKGYDCIMVARKTEDYPPVTVLRGSITKQQCGGGL